MPKNVKSGFSFAEANTIKRGAPEGTPFHSLAAGVAAVVVTAAVTVPVAAVIAAAAAAEQQDQDDDPPAAIVTEQTHVIIVAAHKNTSGINFLSDLPLIPWYSARAKMCALNQKENSFWVLTNLS